MKPARLAVLALAILTGGAATYMMSSGEPPAPVQAVTAKTTDVLVAANDLPMGHSIKGPDLRWQPWPADNVPTGLVKRSEAPGGIDQTAGSITRFSIYAGEPIRREKPQRSAGLSGLARLTASSPARSTRATSASATRSCSRM